MSKINDVVYLAGVKKTENAQSIAPTNLHVISGEVVDDSLDGQVSIQIEGDIFSEDDNASFMVDTLGGLTAGDTATIILSGESGRAMTPLAIGSVGSIDRISLRVNDIEADYVKASTLDADVANIGFLKSDSAVIANLQAADVTINGRLDTAEADIDDLEAEDARIGNLVAQKASITDLNAATARIGSLEAADVTINGRLDTAEADIDDLEAEDARIGNLVAQKASITDLNAATARIGDLEADHVSVEDFEAEQANIDTLQANTADIATIRANSAKVQNLTAAQLEADHATVGSLSTTYATITNLDAATGRISDLESTRVRTTDLEANYITADAIEATYTKTDFSNTDVAWIQNGTIKDGAISNAMIGSLSASKLTAGTINGNTITVTNLNADNITAGTLNGQRIGEGSLSLSKLEEDVYTESEVDSIVSNLQTQIDGAIETWTGTAVPTLNNSPASGWTTNAVKDTHVGDVYFVVNSNSQQNGYNYRFTKSGSTYSWQLIKDSDVTNALQRLTTAEGKITTFDSDISQLKTDTGTLTTKTTSLETRMSDAESDILDKVDTTTFNEVSDTVDSHSQSISQMSTTLSNKADSSTVTAVTNRVSKNEQDISGINTTIGTMQTTLASKADGSTVETMSTKLNTVSDTVDGHTQSISSINSTLSTKADNSTVSTLSTKVNTIEDTVDGHTQSLQSITSTQTSIQQNAVKSTVQLWFTKANTTAPNKPTAHVTTNNAATGNAWNLAVPTYNASYPNYYYCYEYQYLDGSYGWSAVTRDIATGEMQATARQAQSDIDNLEIGGRNLAFNTAGVIIDKTTLPDDSRSEYSSFDLGRALPFGAGTPIVVSFDLYMPIKTSNPSLIVYNTNNKGPHQTLNTSSVLLGKSLPVGSIINERIVIETSVVVDRSDATLPHDYLEFYSIYGSNNYYRISNLKLEKGNHATDWTPAPEDVDADISTAQTSADNAQATADKNVKESVQLWFTKANGSAPNKPTSAVTSTSTSGNAWTTKVPTYSASYPHYFYCMQYKLADDTYTWSDVVYDQATTEAQSVARTTSTNLSTLQQDYATFKQTTQNFESTIGTTYATKTEVSAVDDKIDNLEIGGRNLLSDSLTIALGGSDRNARTTTPIPLYTWSYSNDGEVHVYSFTSNANGNDGYNNFYTFIQSRFTPGISEMRGREYSWGVDIKVDGVSNLGETFVLDAQIDMRPSKTNKARVSLHASDLIDGAWMHIGTTEIIGSSDTVSLFCFNVNNLGSVAGPFTISYRRPILVYGNAVPQDWTPAPEDVDASIAAVPRMSKINMGSRNFTTAQWKTYGSRDHVENWTTGYNNSHLRVGDRAYVVGTISDQNGGTATIIGEVTAVGGLSGTSYIALKSEQLIFGGDVVSAIESRVSSAETSITQTNNQIALKANASDVYTKTQTDGLISTEVSNRNSAIEQSAAAINLSVSQTYTTKTEFNNRDFDFDNLMPNARTMALGTSSYSVGRWRVAGNGDMSKSRVEIDDGPFGSCGAFQLVGTQTVTSDASCFGMDSFPVVSGERYRMSLYARVLEGSGYAGINQVLTGSSQNRKYVDSNTTYSWASYQCIPLTASWKQVWVEFEALSSASNLYIGGAGTDAKIQMCMVSLKVSQTSHTELESAKSEIKATTDGITSTVEKISSAKYLISSVSAGAPLSSIRGFASTTTTFQVTDTKDSRVGDTIYLKYKDSTRNCYVYIKGVVTAVNSSTSITLDTQGYEDVLPVDTIKSTINQSSDSVKIQARHVEIDGAAIFSDSAFKAAADAAYDAKGSASAVQSNLDNLEIGGTNRLINTLNPTAEKPIRGVDCGTPTILGGTLVYNDGIGIYTTGSNITEKYIRFIPSSTTHDSLSALGLPSSGDFIFSGYIKASISGTGYITVRSQGGPGSWKNTSVLTNLITGEQSSTNNAVPIISGIVNDWTYFSIKISWSDYEATIFYLSFQGYNLVENDTFQFKKLKFEKGSKATDWTPAPEDVDASIPTKVSELTNDSGYQNASQVDSTITSKGYATTTQAQEYVTTAYNEIKSMGEQLIVNGNGFLGNNTNFTALTFDGSVSNNSPGSFTRSTIASVQPLTNYFFPVDPSKTYACEFDVKCAEPGAQMYAMLTFYDADKYNISIQNVSFVTGSTTTLAQPLNNGDTKVYLTSAAGFTNTTAAHQRSLIFWNYTNSFGYTYPPETYSRNFKSGIWADDSAVDKTNNVITLSAAWTGGHYDAGTYVSQNHSGGTFCYFYSHTNKATFPRDWYHVKAYYSGIGRTGVKFWPGTAYCKIGWLWNYQASSSSPQGQLWITNVSVKEDTITHAEVQTSINDISSSAASEEQYIYRSAVSGATSMAQYTTWVTANGDTQNAWTTKRPTYNSSYPVLFVAKQRKTVDGTVTCTTPVKDDTTTIIDGGHITTGTIDTNRLNADTIKSNIVQTTELNADKITSGTIAAARIAAGSIAVGKIDATSGTFNTANIPNLSADKITSGSISADRIKGNVISAVNNGTGTINADKINVSGLTIGYSQLTNPPTIPSKVSDLTNDSGFQTSSQVDTAITSKGYATTTQAQGYADAKDAAIAAAAKRTDVSISVTAINYDLGTATLQATLYVDGIATTSNVTYKWLKDGSVISGQTARTLSVTAAMGLSHVYSCTVTYS